MQLLQSKLQLFNSTSTLSLPSSPTPISLSASKYSNNLILIINQTGTIGSILQAQLQAQGQQDSIYQIATKFGATGSQFYEILFRRMLDLVYVEKKMGKEVRTTLIISLPLKSKEFQEKDYYERVYNGIRKEIEQVV